MSEREIAETLVAFDDDGFMTDAGQWTREIAGALAAEEGIELADRHWVVIDFMRKDTEAQGQVPSLRRITKLSGVGTKELYQLFPKGPAKKVARIAGLGKPKGCI